MVWHKQITSALAIIFNVDSKQPLFRYKSSHVLRSSLNWWRSLTNLYNYYRFYLIYFTFTMILSWSIIIFRFSMFTTNRHGRSNFSGVIVHLVSDLLHFVCLGWNLAPAFDYGSAWRFNLVFFNFFYIFNMQILKNIILIYFQIKILQK
jgi:hypothetical protein